MYQRKLSAEKIKSAHMGSTSVEKLLDNGVGVHFSGLHVDDLEPRNSVEPLATSTTENGYGEPFIIVRLEFS
ncbi:hypothetical protein C4D60_Mb08t33850 [Musa balbisiana]|uniref:Uncharacterized protein n=1 Tax=Musa balbisiana TaxID=52838 RepID=A0A4S8K8H2_MUSBA|nr:hypothetical protein C4D60_Mb08t33850 [Musa balbisiana]